MPSKKYKSELAKFVVDHSGGVSINKLADGIGISQSYMSEMLSGKKEPSVEICNKIADYFGVSRIKIYALMGWVDQSKLDSQLQFYLDLIKNDPDFKELADLYSEFVSADDKKRAVGVLKSLLSYKK